MFMFWVFAILGIVVSSAVFYEVGHSRGLRDGRKEAEEDYFLKTVEESQLSDSRDDLSCLLDDEPRVPTDDGDDAGTQVISLEDGEGERSSGEGKEKPPSKDGKPPFVR